LATCADAAEQRLRRNRNLRFRRADFKLGRRQTWRGLYQKSLAQRSFDQGRRSLKKISEIKKLKN
jgi:hypothetical protein